MFNLMEDEVKRQPMKKEKYGTALNMTPNEKKISFLNRYFVFKKISHVNAEKIAIESIDETISERKQKTTKVEPIVAVKKAKPESEKTLEKSKKARPLNKKIMLLSAATEAIDEAPLQEEPVPQKQTEVTIIKESETAIPSDKKKKVATKKKVTLKIEE
jgi:hypothetical protein